ncbi:hypothetical protein E4K72_08825 [Oxalobacteraceae bacterium OM1]|nr:hypothetical protein E4K72_08825 [Oxalobacteraceae bacterium OM1]
MRLHPAIATVLLLPLFLGHAAAHADEKLHEQIQRVTEGFAKIGSFKSTLSNGGNGGERSTVMRRHGIEIADDGVFRYTERLIGDDDHTLTKRYSGNLRDLAIDEEERIEGPGADNALAITAWCDPRGSKCIADADNPSNRSALLILRVRDNAPAAVAWRRDLAKLARAFKAQK